MPRRGEGAGGKKEYWVDEQNRIQGISVRTFRMGQRAETPYVDGKVEGVYRYYQRHGVLVTEKFFRGGKLEGRGTWWHSNGEVSSECDFERGKPVRLLKHTDSQGRDLILPEGEIEVWKACKSEGVGVYVRLRVPADARRVTPIDTQASLGGRSCKSRVEYAIVVGIEDEAGKPYQEATSFVYKKGEGLVYRVGEIVRPDGYDPNLGRGCGRGINVHRYRDHCTSWFKKLRMNRVPAS